MKRWDGVYSLRKLFLPTAIIKSWTHILLRTSQKYTTNSGQHRTVFAPAPFWNYYLTVFRKAAEVWKAMLLHQYSQPLETRFVNHRLSFYVQGHCSARVIHCFSVFSYRDSDEIGTHCFSFPLLLYQYMPFCSKASISQPTCLSCNSLIHIAMMTKCIRAPHLPGFHIRLSEINMKNLGENRQMVRWTKLLSQTQNCFLHITSFN